MVNILSYVGMNMQSEVCLWTLLGLLRTIFDATLFKVNANLKQVWQMRMPSELTMPVQRVLRTMISGVMLVQCFTVYVYLASYIVLLYPVFLEERPTLVLPWLLLAAIRKLLCELTSLALGLGTCVLLGPARPPCIKFVIFKIASIMPAFYMWMLVYSYYHALKVASAFKTFPAVLPPKEHDYGLELAVRRRRTKSLFGEEQLRRKLIASFYGERHLTSNDESSVTRIKIEHPSRMVHSTETSADDVKKLQSLKIIPNHTSETGSCEDWLGSEIIVPRDTDRILEQFGQMMLRIGVYLQKEGRESITSEILNKPSPPFLPKQDKLGCSHLSADDTDTPPLVGNSKGNTASYLREYPQIFMKKPPDGAVTDQKDKTESLKTIQIESIDGGNTVRSRKRIISNDTAPLEIEKIISPRKLKVPENDTDRNKLHDKNVPRIQENTTDNDTKSGRKDVILKTSSVKDRQKTLSHVTIKSSKDSIASKEKIDKHKSDREKSSEKDKMKKVDDDISSINQNNSNNELNNVDDQYSSYSKNIDDIGFNNITDQNHSNNTLEVKGEENSAVNTNDNNKLNNSLRVIDVEEEVLNTADNVTFSSLNHQNNLNNSLEVIEKENSVLNADNGIKLNSTTAQNNSLEFIDKENNVHNTADGSKLNSKLDQNNLNNSLELIDKENSVHNAADGIKLNSTIYQNNSLELINKDNNVHNTADSRKLNSTLDQNNLNNSLELIDKDNSVHNGADGIKLNSTIYQNNSLELIDKENNVHNTADGSKLNSTLDQNDLNNSLELIGNENSVLNPTEGIKLNSTIDQNNLNNSLEVIDKENSVQNTADAATFNSSINQNNLNNSLDATDEENEGLSSLSDKITSILMRLK